MPELYRKIEARPGTLAQFAAVHVINWQPHWGPPDWLFLEADRDTEQPYNPQAPRVYTVLDTVAFTNLMHRLGRLERDHPSAEVRAQVKRIIDEIGAACRPTKEVDSGR